jgi:hypothetical protein
LTRRISRTPVLALPSSFVDVFFLSWVRCVLRFWMRVVPLLALLYRRAIRLVERFVLLRFEFRYWRTHYGRLTSTLPRGYRIPVTALDLDPLQLGHLADQLRNSKEVVIADIDQDGLLRSHIGLIPGLPLVQFGGPSLLNVDFDNRSITASYIAGSVLREELAKHSAIVRDRDVLNHSPFKELSHRQLWHASIREGKRVLNSVITRDLADRIFDELRKIHAARVEWGDLKYGHIIIEKRTGRPFFIDFDSAGYFPRMPAALFRALRDREIKIFNLHLDMGNRDG